MIFYKIVCTINDYPHLFGVSPASLLTMLKPCEMFFLFIQHLNMANLSYDDETNNYCSDREKNDI